MSRDLATKGGRMYCIESVEKSNPNPFRICALCRHFRILESKREFPQIADTAYITYECAVLGAKGREDYLMDSKPSESYVPHPEAGFECQYWEDFDR